MGSAYQCDRCFRFEEGKPVAGVTFKLPQQGGTSGTKDEAAELCPPCMASLRDWRDELRPGARP